MRFLDLAVAAFIGMSSISAMYYWNPQRSELNTHRLAVQADLRDTLTRFVGTRGLLWFQSSSSQDICSTVESLSNASFFFTAAVDSDSCSASAFRGAAWANLTLETENRTVVLEAWANE